MKDHLEEVAWLVERSGGTLIEIQAAYGHDLFEDTPVTEEEAKRKGVSPAVIAIIKALTNPPEHIKYFDVGILEGKKVQAKWMAAQSPGAKRVKLADQISNLRSITAYPLIRWSREQHLEYIEGSQLVAEACRGISPYLDRTFRYAYASALAAFR